MAESDECNPRLFIEYNFSFYILATFQNIRPVNQKQRIGLRFNKVQYSTRGQKYCSSKHFLESFDVNRPSKKMKIAYLIFKDCLYRYKWVKIRTRFYKINNLANVLMLFI